MTRLLIHRTVLILCLVAFGLGQAVFTSVGVRCMDASGNTRIELVCVKSDKDHCQSLCSDDAQTDEDRGTKDAPLSHAPCEDEPLSQEATAVRPITFRAMLEPAVVPVFICFTIDCWALPGVRSVSFSHARFDPDRPPEQLSTLRTVILIV